jgi:hypothetical protein
MYKIVESPKNTFKVYKKGWFFWWCFRTPTMRGNPHMTYLSLQDAEQAIQRHIKAAEADNNQQEFSAVTMYYNDSGESQKQLDVESTRHRRP